MYGFIKTVIFVQKTLLRRWGKDMVCVEGIITLKSSLVYGWILENPDAEVISLDLNKGDQSEVTIIYRRDT